MIVRVSGTPVPSQSKEKSSVGTSEMKVYQLDDDQIKTARYAAVHKNGLSRLETIKAIASGEKLAALERRKGMKPNEIYYWLKKWDLTGVDAKQAEEILNEKNAVVVENELEIKSATVEPTFKKIVLPKAVCKALNEFQSEYDPAEIIRVYFEESLFDPYLEAIRSVSANLLLKALVLGYEEEIAPEEWLKDIYESGITNPMWLKGAKEALNRHGIHYDWMDQM